MNINVYKLTGVDISNNILTAISGRPVNMSLRELYRIEHSPIYTQQFVVYMMGIPSFVSVHFTRHGKNGCSHYVASNRSDIQSVPDLEINRLTLVNHVMYCNAKHLIDIARLRLCNASAPETIEVMQHIKEAVKTVDPVLYDFLVPDCVYRGGYCHEPKFRACGAYPRGEYNHIIEDSNER